VRDVSWSLRVCWESDSVWAAVLMELIRETISASEGARSMSRVRREGMESVRRRGSMSREEDWVRARV
jgi:hypothetical protein